MNALFIAVLLILASSLASAQYAYSSPSTYYGEYASTYYGTLSQEQCEKGEGQDFIIEILPGDCSPIVVRSDLLEEQNVPVFCKLTRYKINPLIEVPRIKSVSIASGSYPKDVASITFHPYRAALQSTYSQLLGSPFENNLGYVVLFLKQNPIEKNIPNEVVADLSARILYDVTSSFGIGQNQLIIPQLNDDDWKNQYQNYGFWYGKGYVRASQVTQDSATIHLYFDPTRPATTMVLSRNKPSSVVYLPGSECSYGVQATLEETIYPSVKAILEIDGNRVEAYENMTINSKCTVRKIETSSYGVSQSVTIYCSGDGSTHVLYRSGLEAEFHVDNKKSTLGIGGILAVGSENYTVVFMGMEQDKDFAVLEKESDLVKLGDRSKAILDENKRLKGLYESGKLKTEKLGRDILIPDGKVGGITVTLNVLRGVTAKSTELIEKYYQSASSSYDEVVKSWPNVPSTPDSSFGEEALIKRAEMAEKLQKNSDARAYYQEFLNTYPDSPMAIETRKRLSSLSLESADSKPSSIIPGDYAPSSVILRGVEQPKKEELSVNLYINDQIETRGLGEKVGNNWTISKINENSVEFQRISDNIPKTAQMGASAPLPLDDKTSVKLSKINLVRYAKITLDPYSRKGETYANFTVHVGIEKRAIQLSPEKTKSLISDLNNQINALTKIHNDLSNVVEQWKRACLVGTGALWTWNFFENLVSPGQATARTLVMSKSVIISASGKSYTGWTAFCNEPSNRKPRDTLQECLFANKNAIDSDITAAKIAVTKTNDLMEGALDGKDVKQKVGFLKLSTAINQNAYADSIQKVIDGDNIYSKLQNQNISGHLKDGRITQSDIRDAVFELNVQKECVGKTTGICSTQASRVTEVLGKIENANKASIVDAKYGTLSKELGIDFPVVRQGVSPNVIPATIVDSTHSIFNNATTIKRYEQVKGDPSFKTSKIALVALQILQPTGEAGKKETIDGGYLFILNDGRDSYNYDRNKIYKYNGSVFVKVNNENEINTIIRDAGRSIKKQEKCDWAYSSTPEIQFWDSGASKGLPAIMPLGQISTLRGFYVATESQGTSLTSGLTSSAFAESGSPQTFWICNVGENRVQNFGQIGSDDEGCQRFSLAETYSSGLSTMCGGVLSQKETTEMVNKAITCMKQAASQYGKVSGTLKTNCGTFKIGAGKSSVPNVQCEDFMSPEKCSIMYNLCDPVICPISRCNWGGRYPVDNVISSGIIGSLLFCQQNAGTPFTNGGVMVPVCLTGINAELENWITMLNDTRKCLNESLTTGRTVGICDQLKSVYLCQIFWKEITPFIKTGIPYLVENTINKRTGGGEYLTFKDTWDNSIKQFNYATQYFGANSLRAFQVRSTEEVGDMVCNAFWGVRYPNQGDLFSEMAKPESPVQYNAWFDEEVYSSVTIPPISHYKVYYHIYAGNDNPVYWSVYLSEPQSYTYPLAERATIASGYLEMGKSVDETRDLTLASGYKKLCVSINGVSRCDFQKVSTGFGVDQLVNYYVADQTIPNYAITTADECTSGASSLLTGSDLPTSLVPILTSPGQGGLEEILQPEIWRRGIIRICSQDDPGKGGDEERWSAVGFCDVNKKVRCWLDTRSVEGAISDLNLSGMTLEQARANQGLFTIIGTYINDTQSNITISQLRKEIEGDLFAKITSSGLADDFEIRSMINPYLDDLNNLIQRSRSDRAMAEAQLLIGRIYNKVVDRLLVLAPPISTGVSRVAVSHCDFVTKIRNCIAAAPSHSMVPDNLIIGVSVLESDWGTKPIGNNYFGIKPSKTWTGKTKDSVTTEYTNNVPYKVMATFRDYDSMCDSVNDFISLMNVVYSTEISSHEGDLQGMVDAIGKRYATHPQWASLVKSRINQIPSERKCNIPTTVTPVDTQPVLQGASITQVNYTYIVGEGETLESIAFKIFGSMHDYSYNVVNKIYNDIDNSFRNVNPFLEKINITQELAPGEIKMVLNYEDSQQLKNIPPNCADFKATWANLDKTDCHLVNLLLNGDILRNEKCFFIPDVIGINNNCVSCSQAKNCSDFNNDEERCNDLTCTGKIQCEYVNKKCVIKGTEKKAEELYGLAANIKNDNLKKSKAYADVIKKYPGTISAKNAIGQMMKIAEASNGDIILYGQVAQFGTPSYQEKDPYVYAVGMRAKTIISAINAFDNLNADFNSCYNSNLEYCMCFMPNSLNNFSNMTNMGFSIDFGDTNITLKYFFYEISDSISLGTPTSLSIKSLTNTPYRVNCTINQIDTSMDMKKLLTSYSKDSNFLTTRNTGLGSALKKGKSICLSNNKIDFNNIPFGSNNIC